MARLGRPAIAILVRADLTMAEFDLIELIRRSTLASAADSSSLSSVDAGLPRRTDTVLGIGDDGAVLDVHGRLVVVSDTLVEGVHFFPDCPPADLGWKSLAVNLSDLAAMGAQPAWALLNLSLPQADAEFVQAFMQGFNALAQSCGVELVGGDTTRGPLTVTVTALGNAPAQPLLRRGAQVDDWIAVSGPLGDAAWAYQARYRQHPVPAALWQRLQRPQPQLALGQALSAIARCGMDLSDGLLADLGHILRQGALSPHAAMNVGADLHLAQLPSSPALCQVASTAEQRWPLQLAGGDDYELLLIIPPAQRAAAEQAAASCGESLHWIGRISATPGVRCHHPAGGLFTLERHGYQHFEETPR